MQMTRKLLLVALGTLRIPSVLTASQNNFRLREDVHRVLYRRTQPTDLDRLQISNSTDDFDREWDTFALQDIGGQDQGSDQYIDGLCFRTENCRTAPEANRDSLNTQPAYNEDYRNPLKPSVSPSVPYTEVMQADTGELPPFPKYIRGFPALKWLHDIPKPIVKMIYKELTRYWPIQDDIAARRWDTSISRHLDHNPRLVHGLLSNDPDVWLEVKDWCKADSMHYRSKIFSRLNKRTRHNIPITVNWLAGNIFTHDKDYIFDRLRLYWNGVSPTAIQGRLLSYVKLYGKIHSPEPLLDPDEVTFRKAADLIFMRSDRRRLAYQHVDAGPNDILHQASRRYGIQDADGKPIFLPYEVTQKRPSAKRYHTQHAWLNNLSMTQIDYIHGAVAAHYAKDMKAQKKLRLLLAVNEYLDCHPGTLELIKGGSDYAAWQVARDTARQPYYMQHPDQYCPSNSSAW